MKKIVLAGYVALFAFAANAQSFKKGENVEVNKMLSEDDAMWVKASITEVDGDSKIYSVKTLDKKSYRIPFSKEDAWLRKTAVPLTTAKSQASVVFVASPDLLKQKIKEQFDADFSEYDSVIIKFDNVETMAAYANADDALLNKDTEVHPYQVDLTLRLVTKNSDGTPRKINWQFKRKYLLFQDNHGKIRLSVADKEELVLNHI